MTTAQPLPQQPIPQPTQPVQTPTLKPIQTQPPTPQDNKKSFWLTLIALIAASAVTIFLLVLLLLHFLPKNVKIPLITSTPTPTPTPAIAPHASIQGNIMFEGYASSDMYIAIAEKSDSSTDFKDVVSGINPTQGNISWTWTDAKIGTNYQIKATLKQKGVVLVSSPAVTVSAPATNVTLPIVSELAPPTPTLSAISGTVNVDGYVPSGSVVNILAQVEGSSTFTTIASNLTPSNNTTWSWQQATTGKTYAIQAVLLNSGTIIGNTQTTVNAPASNVNMVLSSTANPPQPTVTGLSGTITINGNIPSNANITLGIRQTGQSTFNQVASNISANNGVSWSWNGATTGTSYDIQAYLWSNNQPYSQSNILTVTAPSDNDILTINAQQPTSAPGGNTINVSCGGKQNGMDQITVNYNTQGNLSNPYSYNIVVTLASQGTQAMNTIVTPNNPTQAQSVTSTYIITPGATYFAQYAYNTSSGGAFTSLSPYYQFSCN